MMEWSDPYWKLITVTFSDFLRHERIELSTFTSICKGLIEIIAGWWRSAFGETLADNEIDFNEIPVEYHEQDQSFDRQTF